MLKQALVELFISFGIDNNEMINIYLKKLKQSGVDESIIIKSIDKLSITWKPEYGRKIPSVSEIVGLNIESIEYGEYEEAWQEFKKTCCNNYRYEPMPDWVFTIKKLIGVYEVEEMTYESEKWVKKEFMKIIPSLRSGNLKLLSEDVKYISDGSVTLLDSYKVTDKLRLMNKEQSRLLERSK